MDLSYIPCPAGDKCTAFKCIFGHARDKVPSKSSAPNQDVTQKVEEADTSPPRKRVRVDEKTPSSTQPPASKANDAASEARPPQPSSDTIKVPLTTDKRPISPPPLKRPTTKVLSAAPRRPVAVSTQQQPRKHERPRAPAKAESLNPRLLKSSPASHEVRTKLLRLLHAEYVRLNKELKKNANDEEEKLLLTDQEIIIRVLDEEQSMAMGKASIYANIMKNKVMTYKRMKVGQWKEERVKAREAEIKKNRGIDSSEEPKKIETGLSPEEEVQVLKRILTPIANLANHGYVPTVPTEEAIKSARDGKEAGQGWEKCDRCQQRFQVFPGRRSEDGALTSGGTCKFHWGKPYIPTKNPGDTTRPPKRYQCCGEDMGESAGCFTNDYHVYKASNGNTLATVLNFKETPENDRIPTNRAVGFDCEMGYTVHGLELIRLTAVSWPTGEELLDVLVHPVGEILDLNSRYSGVFPDDMAQAKPWTESDGLVPAKCSDKDANSEDGEAQSRSRNLRIVSSPEVARDLLFSLISPSTPLIGHGLENDLNAVRIVHPTVVDTVLLYPHKAGLPFRYGLKMLMDHHLNRKIQQETGPKVLGHDSAEDARAAGDLVRLKVAREWGRMQRDGWKLVDGEFISPARAP